ncbi:hypothetical protein [Mucilaginibacter ginsenosidivorans]|uniref:Uncharacterized protein n=1 Tax=Mucilaginibacter ginsenosidivorans TaxID=398053 RepID=A0A5B8UTH5_9SPHI|nr:hypothetical protein [Mucilaginibacter ginsenosidivorans]QEC61691.1 hypothetical protein FRZ54_03530 [Mucilaginibacter ginsenosidivorans]
MGLFSIFKKRKDEPEITIVPSDGVVALTDGILFEDAGIFLKWGVDIEADKLYAKKEFRADRTIYQWGQKKILNGLSLPLKTVCWNHEQHSGTKSLESVEFLSENEDAKHQFQAIRDHLETVLGKSRQDEDMEPGEAALEWRIKAVKVVLNLYNKERPKVKFEMGWWV